MGEVCEEGGDGAAVKLIIAGSRSLVVSIPDIDSAVERLRPRVVPSWGRYWVTQVVCGMARGADYSGLEWAAHHGIDLHRDPVTSADYAKHGRYIAPKIRNNRMADYADAAIVFWDGVSGGSADMHARMSARGKPSLLVQMRGWP